MTLVTIAVIAVLGATVALVVDRRMQAQKKAEKQDATQQEQGEDNQQDQEKSGGVVQYVTSVRNRLFGSKQERARKFQTWAEAHIEDADLKAWLTGLSPEAASALADQLADFCVNLGFELQWLLDGNMDHDQEIKQEATAVVTAYCRACWRAAQNYNDFELFKVLREIEQSPFSRKNQDLARQVFGELVKREMAASVPPDLFLASEKERQEHMASAIKQSAETERDKFKTVLKDVLAVQEAGDGQPEAASEKDAEKTEEDASRQRRFFAFGKGKNKDQATGDNNAAGDEHVSGSPATEPSAS
jgi:hypothetical protein